jgi:hypothetical protein
MLFIIFQKDCSPVNFPILREENTIKNYHFSIKEKVVSPKIVSSLRTAMFKAYFS